MKISRTALVAILVPLSLLAGCGDDSEQEARDDARTSACRLYDIKVGTVDFATLPEAAPASARAALQSVAAVATEAGLVGHLADTGYLRFKDLATTATQAAQEPGDPEMVGPTFPMVGKVSRAHEAVAQFCG